VSWAKTRLFIGVADQMCIFVGADHLSGSYCYIYIQYCTWIALLLSYYIVFYLYAIKKVARYVYAIKKFIDTCMPCIKFSFTSVPFRPLSELTVSNR
jgi:hypothetical protein